MTQKLLSWLLTLLFAYALIVTLVWLFQSRLIYFPSRELVADPASRELAFEDVRLRTNDGETLHGWFVPGSGEGPTVLFFHGNAGNISHRIDSIALIVDAGASVLIIDYRGYGKSTGSPSEHGTYQDAEAAYLYLTREKQIASWDVIVFGRSLGGGVASWLAVKHPAAMLVLESTFTSVPELAAQVYPWLPARWLANIYYDTGSRIGDLETPTVVMHSVDDELIGFDHGRRLFEQAGHAVEMVEMSGGHNTGFADTGMLYREAWERVVRGVRQDRR